MRQNKGITLIALVITIIVLLILAGVTMAMVMGNDGIFTKAEQAKNETNRSQTEGEVKLAVLESAVNNDGKKDFTLLVANLKESLGVTDSDITNQGSYLQLKYNGETFLINTDYKIESDNIKYEQIKTPQDLQKMSKGNYQLANDIDLTGFDWKSIKSFEGTLDGNGKKIKNLTLSEINPLYDNGGVAFTSCFIDTVKQGTTIRNIEFENINLKADGNTADKAEEYGNTMVGIDERQFMYFIIGTAVEDDFIAENVVVSGTIKEETINVKNLENYWISIIGMCTSENSHLIHLGIEATGTSRMNIANFFGVMGNNIKINGCYIDSNLNAPILATSFAVGGNAKMNKCYINLKDGSTTLGVTLINQMLGGNLEVSNSYINTNQNKIEGILVVPADSSCVINMTNCYGKGSAIIDSGISGITLTNCYTDIPQTATGVTVLTDEQMKQKASFAGFDFEKVWDIQEGTGYPFLRK